MHPDKRRAGRRIRILRRRNRRALAQINGLSNELATFNSALASLAPAFEAASQAMTNFGNAIHHTTGDNSDR